MRTLKHVIKECYSEYTSTRENKNLYKEIAELFNLYAYVKETPNVQPYVIIDKK